MISAKQQYLFTTQYRILCKKSTQQNQQILCKTTLTLYDSALLSLQSINHNADHSNKQLNATTQFNYLEQESRWQQDLEHQIEFPLSKRCCTGLLVCSFTRRCFHARMTYQQYLKVQKLGILEPEIQLRIKILGKGLETYS